MQNLPGAAGEILSQLSQSVVAMKKFTLQLLALTAFIKERPIYIGPQ